MAMPHRPARALEHGRRARRTTDSLLSLLILFGLASACGPGPDLEDQVADSNQRSKKPCPDLPTSGYRVSPELAGALALEVMDCGFAFPSRLRFDPSGRILLVTELKGVLQAYLRDESGSLRLLPEPLHDLGDLGVRDEAGLTSVFFGVGFDLDVEAPERRDVFLSFQRRIDGEGRNLLRRITLERRGSGLAAVDPEDIWIGGRTGQAHQIQDGFGLEVNGRPHVLFAVGDGNNADNARDPSTSGGTLQLVQRDGAPPEAPHPFPGAPTTRAIGLRNAYSLVRLPETIDPRQGVVGLENGNEDIDRAWLVRLEPEDGGPPAPMDLGYVGEDSAQTWSDFEDPHTRGALGGARTAVFRTFSPTISPTGAALHPGGGPIPLSDRGTASLVVAFFGKSGRSTPGPGKTIERITVSNIEGAALQSERQRLVERRPETDGEYRHPVGLDVDPTNGDVWFSDIISGELTRVRVP